MSKDKLLKAIDKKMSTLDRAIDREYWKQFRQFVDDFNEDKIQVDWDKLMKTFNEICGKKMRVVNGKVKRQIQARLKEGYTKDMIVAAMKNSINDPYHVETNKRYITLEYMSRGYIIDKYQEQIEENKSEKKFEARTETYSK